MDSSIDKLKKENKPKAKHIFVLLAVCLILLVVDFLSSGMSKKAIPSLQPSNQSTNSSSFSETFDSLKLNEVGKMKESSSLDWWLNSGGFLYSENGIGKTFQGNVPEDNPWYKIYLKSNPRDTDNGSHPQNIFRLVTRNKWQNLSQQSYFEINANNFSKSKYRDESNGLLLFNRYQDGNNLYYTGIRVDGTAVIKKKIKGNYFTMAQKIIYEGKYNKKDNPNLLPMHTWIGIKSEVITNPDDSVDIKLYLDSDRSGNWSLVLTAKDDNSEYGGEAIKNAGYAGIRTDFMDVQFDDYKIEEIK